MGIITVDTKPTYTFCMYMMINAIIALENRGRISIKNSELNALNSQFLGQCEFVAFHFRDFRRYSKLFYRLKSYQ